MNMPHNPEPIDTEHEPVTRDPIREQEVLQRIAAEDSVLLGFLAGAAAAALGSILLAGVYVITNLQSTYFAIGIGALVGIAIQKAGRGTRIIFGIMGALLSIFSALFADVLFNVSSFCAEESLPFGEIMLLLIKNPSELIRLMVDITGFVDLIFLGFSGILGYSLSKRELNKRERDYINHERDDL